MMRRPSYRRAITWLIENDDTEWVTADPQEGGGALSVTAALVADLFGVEDDRVRRDLARMLKERQARITRLEEMPNESRP
jgi:hypothetical protein